MATETRSVNAACITTYNPATCEPLAELRCASADDVLDAVLRAR